MGHYAIFIDYGMWYNDGDVDDNKRKIYPGIWGHQIPTKDIWISFQMRQE